MPAPIAARGNTALVSMRPDANPRTILGGSPAMKESLVKLPPALTPPTPSAGARYVMGMDGGATKTMAAVLDLETLAVHVAHGGARTQGADRGGAALRGRLPGGPKGR